MVTDELVMNKIFIVRGKKVMLDNDLASLYQVETKQLNQAVKRNADRFPPDFMFQLTEIEFENLKSQFATSRWGGRRKLPMAFTKHGVSMLKSLRSQFVILEIQIKKKFYEETKQG